jgi:tetratricopeptide (TPR) repeat protein
VPSRTHANLNADEHAVLRSALERAVQQAPGHADCWAMLSLIYREEYAHGFNPRPDPVGRAFEAARRAVEAGPSNHFAYHALASALFFRREVQAFRSAAQRAVELNPMDGFTVAYMGFLTAYTGDWERGCALASQARNLNPRHPGWYWFPDFFDAYRKRDYPKALEVALKIHMPAFWRANLALAAVYGQLNDRDSAGRAVKQLLALRPGFANEARAELAKWWDPELTEHLIDGLRKAGLDEGQREPRS